MKPSIRIGLELGSRTLRLVWVSPRRDGTLQWHYREQIRTTAEEASLPSDLTQLLSPLRAHRFTATLLLIAPPSYVRQMTLRVSRAKRLAEAVREQLPTLLPFESQEAQVQFVTQRRQRVDGQLACTLTIGACETAGLLQDLACVERAGWVVSGVVPSALALVQAAHALDGLSGASTLLVHLGPRTTTMALVDQGEVIYARDVTIGDEHLTDALMSHVSVGQQTLSLSRAQAEALKERLGVPEAPSHEQGLANPAGVEAMPVPTYLAMIQPVLEQLLSEVRRTMAFGAQQSTANVPAHILLSGAGVRLPHCDVWLAQRLGCSVTPLDCHSLLGPSGAAAAATCGLVASPHPPLLDLQPRAARHRGVFIRLARRTWRAFVAVSVVLWAVTGWWMIQDQMDASQRHALDRRWQSIQPAVSLEDALSRQGQLEHRLIDVQGLPLAWFHRLAQSFPGSVRLTQLAVDTQRLVSMSGQAQERQQSVEAEVSAFQLWLQRTGVCREPRFGATRRADVDGEVLVEFSLVCQRG